MPFVPLGEWMPDQADYQNPGAAIIQNVYPRTSSTYGPVGALAATASVLGNRCQGAYGARDSDGNAYDFAGDSTKLYYLNASAANFTDISKAGGYHITTDQQWHFAQFANRFLACNISDNIQNSLISGGVPPTCSDLASAAPQARYMAIVKDFLMVGNTNGGTADPAAPGAKPQRIWWSAIGDPTNWPTTGTAAAAAVQSDFQDVQGDHGWLTGIVANVGPVDAVAFFQGAVFRVMYVGAPDVFSILPARGIKGCVAPGSIQNTPLGVFYLGPDGFYLFDGIQNTPLGYGKIDKWFEGQIDPGNILRISATVDPVNPIVWVAFPSLSNSGGNPDTILACNYALTSKIGTPGVWALLPSINTEFLFRAVSLGYTLDQLDTVGNLDALPASLDSQIWQGNAQYLLGAFDTNHKMNFFTGSNLAPTLETTESEIVPGKHVRVRRALPIMDGGTPSIAVGHRKRNTDGVTYATATAMNADGFCPLNVEDRFFRFRLTASSGTSFNHAKGVLVPPEAITATGTR